MAARLILSLLLLLAAASVHAAEPVDVVARPAANLLADADRIEGAGGRLTFSTAPDAEGLVRRVEVRSQVEGASGDWIVFALTNPSDTQVDRLIVAPHARLVGSGWWRPDLASRRIAAITPSEGFALEGRVDGAADIFQVTLDPGATVTFAAELAAGQARALPEFTVWDPEARKDALNGLTLYHGVVLGIAAVVAMFATVLLVVRGAAIFLAATWLAGAALAFAALRFGFLGRLLQPDVADFARWQAWTEIALATGLVAFPFAYLALGRWVARSRWVLFAWLAVLAGAAVLATFDARAAATLARISMALAVGSGLVLAFWLALRRFDRGALILPAWIVAVGWTVAAWAVVTGRVDDAVAEPALVGGLVLLSTMLAITVAQHAFPTAAPLKVDDGDRRALALEGAGDAVFDWDVAQDRVSIGPAATAALGLRNGELDGPLSRVTARLHPEDRDRFRSSLTTLAERGAGRLNEDVRLRGAESGTLGRARNRWYRLRARPVRGSDGAIARCIGTMIDVTEESEARERLLRDAVQDRLTGLPNRELFVDRLRSALALARAPSSELKPAIFLIDIDRFSHINETFGVSAADDVLVVLSRRLLNVVKPQDCLARIGSDRFALVILSQADPEGVALLADRLQRAVRLPVAGVHGGRGKANGTGEDIAVTASIGMVSAEMGEDAGRARAEGLIADAEIAVAEAKRLGGDRVEPFKPAMRTTLDRDYQFENDLRHALERREIEMHYQPIVDLRNDRIAGFEALMRWRSPERGLVPPDDFIPLAERTGLIVQLGVFALDTAMEALARLRDADGRGSEDGPFFMAVNISSRQLMRHDLIGDVKGVLDRSGIRDGLKLELTESMVLDNPEQAAIVLGRVKALGATLALDDFGTGHSSLSQLTRFPFDTIKIDRSLVRGGSDDGSDEEPVVLRALVAMVHGLGMDVVAEGLESDEDEALVRALDCRYAQGFALGGPIELDAALRQVKKAARSGGERKAA